MASALLTPAAAVATDAPAFADGLEIHRRLDEGHGALHLEAAEMRLAPGGTVGGHVRPAETSFFLLEGEVLVAIADTSYHLRPGDFGLIPFGYPAAWSNPFDTAAVWLQVGAPGHRRQGPIAAYRPHPHLAPPGQGERVVADSPHQRFVGHFDDSQVPPPGPLAMPGYHGYGIDNVSVRMMVDDLLGAIHHTLFVVEFAPAEGFSAAEHYHPFEELYYFTAGAADGLIEGRPCRVETGDLVFAGVGATHGFTNAGSVPVRWIEAQAPMPPRSAGTVFVRDWAREA